jgi:hypothetical protein
VMVNGLLDLFGIHKRKRHIGQCRCIFKKSTIVCDRALVKSSMYIILFSEQEGLGEDGVIGKFGFYYIQPLANFCM